MVFGWGRSVVFDVGMGERGLKDIYFLGLNRPSSTSKSSCITPSLPQEGFVSIRGRRKLVLVPLWERTCWTREIKHCDPGLFANCGNCSPAGSLFDSGTTDFIHKEVLRYIWVSCFSLQGSALTSTFQREFHTTLVPWSAHQKISLGNTIYNSPILGLGQRWVLWKGESQ